MLRGFAVAVLDHFARRDVSPVYFVEAQFASGTERYCQLPYDVQWGGHTWKAGGGLLSVSKLEEEASPDSIAHRVVLAGIEPETMGRAMTENPAWRWLIVYLGGRHPVTGQVIADPYPVISGLMSKPRIVEQAGDPMGGQPSWLGGTVAYEITVESETVRQGRVAGRLRTHRQHLEKFPGDTFHKFQARLSDHTGVSPGPGFEPRRLYD